MQISSPSHQLDAPAAAEPVPSTQPKSEALTEHVFGLLALSASIIVLLWVAVVIILQQDHDNTRRQALANLSNLSRAFAEHTAKTIEGADQAVRFVRNEYLEHGEQLDIRKYLDTRAIIDSDYHLLTVIGADGYVVASSQPFTRIDLHEREHFRVHAVGSEDRLFISKPVLGKVSGKWSIQVTRRIDRPDGSFGGVVVVSMPPEYFTRFYRDVELGPSSVITLLGSDGWVRARASREGQQQGMRIGDGALANAIKTLQNGTVEARSSIDNVDRLWAFRTLPSHGLTVMTGMGVDDAMAEYRERRQVIMGIGLLVTLVTLLFTASLYRRIRRQVELVEALRQSEVQAQAANRLKSKFLASVSHELRTPLNGILGYAELIRDTASDEQAAEFGGIIHDSAKHLHSLVNTILDLAKIESGHMVANRVDVPLRSMLEDMQRLHVVHAQARGLALEMTIDPACPQSLYTDRTRLVQVLSNVVNNAIKFTERGSVTLAASMAGDALQITVRDTGIGIAPARLATLFNRFQGAAEELVHVNQGAGLGLPLAKELTELLGGTLTLQSEIGVGTEVRIRLPLRQPSPTMPESTPAVSTQPEVA